MKPFIDEIANLLKITRLDLIEKDIILHNLILSLSENDLFNSNFLFKGGTCLIKSYLGYYRFSEDIDFTWRDQNVFENMSQKRIRKYLAEIIDKIGIIIEDVSKNQKLEFRCDKSDKKYIELGGSNKFVTYKIWYESEVLQYYTFLKIQINFVEKIKYPVKEKKLKSLLSEHKYIELKQLFPEEYGTYSREVEFKAYDINEILCEKVRSILTRRGIKARDFVDIYLITKKYNVKIYKYKPQIVEKTIFTLDMYEKYRTNLKKKLELIESGDIFKWGAEKELLLQEIDEKDFNKFVIQFIDFLQDLVKDI